jgi:NAD(P)-dependent dehydrogenase (short-subunit alcohol dehydrogenase family)
MLLKGEVAIVAGGGRGIGRAIAKKFAAAGASVAMSARTEKEMEQVAREIQDAGGKAASVAGDVSREPDCEKIVREARNAFGAIHVLVNNAGLLGPVAPMEQVRARWRRKARARECG